MSLLLATVLMSAAPVSAPAAAATAGGVCSWNEPGHNRYRGTLAAAVDRYTDIPAPVRERLKARMASFRYDEMAAIRRDSITGHARYAPELRDMHFGAGQVCGQVDRSRWDEQMVERGLVYCEGEHCLIVPTVCRNVSRVTRLSTPPPPSGVPGSPLKGVEPAAADFPTAAGPATPLAEGPDTELPMEPTSAGPSFEQARTTDPASPVSTADVGMVPPALTPVWWPGSGTGSSSFGPAGNNGPALEPISVGNIGDPIGPSSPPTTPTPPAVPEAPTPPGGGPFGPDPFPGPLPEPLPEPFPGPFPDPFPGPVPDPFPVNPPPGATEPVGPWTPEPPPMPPIPEPASGLLALLGMVALFGWRRLRAR